MFDEYPDILNINQLCTALGIGRNKAYALINSNQISCMRIGKTIKVPKYCLTEYIRKTVSANPSV